MPWRVQATWTVDGEPHAYSPVFVRTRWGAARTRRRIEQTLWHFPTLVVQVERVGEAEMRAEQAERAAVAPEPVIIHLMVDPERRRTACGLDAGEVSWTVTDFLEADVERCPACEAVARGA